MEVAKVDGECVGTGWPDNKESSHEETNNWLLGDCPHAWAEVCDDGYFPLTPVVMFQKFADNTGLLPMTDDLAMTIADRVWRDAGYGGNAPEAWVDGVWRAMGQSNRTVGRFQGGQRGVAESVCDGTPMPMPAYQFVSMTGVVLAEAWATIVTER